MYPARKNSLPNSAQFRAVKLLRWLLIGATVVSLQLLAQNPSRNSTKEIVEWEMGIFLENEGGGLTRTGEPRILETPLGKAVYFDGVDDGLFLDVQPLVGLRRFTVEVVFRPDPDGLPEQRFLHIGEMRGSRLMLETRLTKENKWYLDAHVRSGDNAKTLIDSTKLHSTGVWQSVAFVFNDGAMDAYVDGTLELSGTVDFAPFSTGQTSIGVRQNKVSWFKGAILKIRITPRNLNPSEFLKTNE